MSGRGSKAMRIKLFVRSRASDVFTFDEVHWPGPQGVAPTQTAF
jgi:hypothetical protein